MGASTETQLIAELEATLEEQQTAVDQGNAAIRETIGELHAAVHALDQRQNSLTEAAADLAGRAVTGLDSESAVPFANCHASRCSSGERETRGRATRSVAGMTPVGVKLSATLTASIIRFAWVLLIPHLFRQYSSNVPCVAL